MNRLKILAAILAAVVLVIPAAPVLQEGASYLAIISHAVEALPVSGICGDELTWEIDEGGTLTISGRGDMPEWYGSSEPPWDDYSWDVTSVVVEEGVTSLGNYAFWYFRAMTSVSLPSSLTSIGHDAFSGCSSLTSFTIPYGVTRIEYGTFEGCSSLASITIPESVTSIGVGSFSGTVWLKEHPLAIVNNILIDGTACEGDVVIPDGVTEILGCAFENSTGLTSVTIPESVASIGYYAFNGCTDLRTVTISNPYCRMIQSEFTIPEIATICGYPYSTAQAYAEMFGREFTPLEGESSMQYHYEIIPVLSPFNNYFFVKTDDPDPTSFRFADKNSAYSEDSVIAASATQFSDVLYDDMETLRVNGGYLFYSGTTDGGEVSLQIRNVGDSWLDIGQTFTLPELCDTTDYLIRSYATESDFFANMDAVQSGFQSICLYSGSYIRGELTRPNPFWHVATSMHIDQAFYLYSPYHREDNKLLFASSIYPFRYDSLGFPSIIASVSQRLDSASSYVWSSSNHYEINVTYGGITRTYGGAGEGEGQGLSEDKISRFFTFDDADETISLENIRQLLNDYAAIEMQDDIPREDALTWETICNTVNDGAWVRISGSNMSNGDGTWSLSPKRYAYLYKENDRNSYTADEWGGVGHSLYWWGSLGYASDAWVDGRYVDAYERYVPGATFEEYPESDIILPEATLPVVDDYHVSYEYHSDTGEYEAFYSNVEMSEMTKTVRYCYNSEEGIWEADNYSNYYAIMDMTEQGAIDEKYLDMLQLTYDEVMALGIDRNTNTFPESGYSYDGTVEPGTPFSNLLELGDVNGDGTVDASDAAEILKEAALIGVGNSGTFSSEQRTAADVNNDDETDASDAAAILSYAAASGTGYGGKLEDFV